ncbi:MAG: type II toxin-antitoxin system HicB family antitoxin [Reyranellaceae bacterium]
MKDIETVPLNGAHVTRRYAIELLPFEEDEGKGFTVLCPSLPGLVTQGASLQQCLERAEEAILCYIETLKDFDDPIPPSDAVDSGKTMITVCLD